MKNQLNGSGRGSAVAALAVVAVLAAVTPGSASGPIGIYGIVERVVFEPNDRAPERVQIWGAFAHVEEFSSAVSPPKRGYLYFRLPASGESVETVRKEWADLKALAGSGQAVGFGSWGWSSVARAELSDLRVRAVSEPVTSPTDYRTNAGIVKLSATGSHAAIVTKLKDALEP
jgi:hypothetical protein